MYVYIYIYIHTHAHTHTHTQICISNCAAYQTNRACSERLLASVVCSWGTCSSGLFVQKKNYIHMHPARLFHTSNSCFRWSSRGCRAFQEFFLKKSHTHPESPFTRMPCVLVEGVHFRFFLKIYIYIYIYIYAS